MSEAAVIAATPRPHTIESLARDLRAAGLAAGDHVMVHVALSRIGWIAGGAGALITALQTVITPEGTLLMPAHTGNNSDPALWQNPPVPPDWVQTIRDHSPPFDPARTPTYALGTVAELFRTLPGVLRSHHPLVSCAAWGRLAHFLTEDHALDDPDGPRSPIGRLYASDGKVLLIGVDHDNNTSLHQAEHLATWPGKHRITQGAAVLRDGRRHWITYDIPATDTDDFQTIGQAFEAQTGLTVQKLGNADLRLMSQRALVDFATAWMTANRNQT